MLAQIDRPLFVLIVVFETVSNSLTLLPDLIRHFLLQYLEKVLFLNGRDRSLASMDYWHTGILDA